MPSYKCPGCHEVQGKWTKTLAHMKECCPHRKGSQRRQKCEVKKVKKDKTLSSKPNRAKSLAIDGQESEGARIIIPPPPENAVAVKKIKSVGKPCHHYINQHGRKSKRRHCQTFVDPQRLFLLTCTVCGSSYVYSNQPEEYLWCRRRTRKEQGLLSITAPLDGASCSLLSKVNMSCGIESNTAMPHITFVEGLLPDQKHFAVYLRQLKSLRMALVVDSSIQIVEIHAVPRKSDDTTVLIVANVGVRQPVVTASRALASNEGCVFPQFPFHIALGACSKETQKEAIDQVSQRLVNITLSGIDSTLVAVLPPPVHDKLFLANSNGRQAAAGDKIQSRQEREEETFQRFPNIVVARQAADSLNESLAASPTFTWSRTDQANKQKQKA